MSEEQEKKIVKRVYNCNYCKKTHFVELSEDLAKDQPRYPFPHVFLHSSEGELNDILTTLYLDAQLQIRGVEVMKLAESDIFSEALTKKITDKLMEMIVKLEEENVQLRGLLEHVDLNDLQDSYVDIELNENIENINLGQEKQVAKKKWRIYVLSLIDGEERQDLLITGEESIEELKKIAGNSFGLKPLNFRLSFEGLLLKENSMIMDYNIQNGDELVLIPAKK